MPLDHNTKAYLPHRGQLPVLGREGQEALRTARVHVSGAGRIGSWVAMGLTAAGIGNLSINDPQVIESDNIGSFLLAGRSDLGKAKTLVLARSLHGKSGSTVQAVVAPTESATVDPCIKLADLVISCANTLAGRRAAEEKAIRYGKPVLQVAAIDGRQRLAGVIMLRLPVNTWSACFGCYVAEFPAFRRGEGLLSTATGTLAAIASNIAVQLITGARADYLRQHNYFSVDLESYRIEALAVERLAACTLCGDTGNEMVR